MGNVINKAIERASDISNAVKNKIKFLKHNINKAVNRQNAKIAKKIIEYNEKEPSGAHGRLKGNNGIKL